MKKIFILALIGLFGITGVRAQFADYGVRAGLGLATISDDLSTKSPILGATVGGYINYTFRNTQSVVGQFLYLQSGLNLNRRGSNFHEVLENENTLSVRDGYYHAYYLQLPILVGFHMELPIRSPGHLVGVFVGPTVNVGLFGRCKDRVVSPGNPAVTANYDYDINGTAKDRAVFNHLKRLDVGVMVGLSYEYGPWNATLYFDHGFLATSTEPDILRIITQNMGGDKGLSTEAPNGYNTAVMISVGYALGNFSN